MWETVSKGTLGKWSMSVKGQMNKKQGMFHQTSSSLTKYTSQCQSATSSRLVTERSDRSTESESDTQILWSQSLGMTLQIIAPGPIISRCLSQLLRRCSIWSNQLQMFLCVRKPGPYEWKWTWKPFIVCSEGTLCLFPSQSLQRVWVCGCAA